MKNVHKYAFTSMLKFNYSTLSTEAMSYTQIFILDYDAQPKVSPPVWFNHPSKNDSFRSFLSRGFGHIFGTLQESRIIANDFRHYIQDILFQLCQ